MASDFSMRAKWRALKSGWRSAPQKVLDRGNIVRDGRKTPNSYMCCRATLPRSLLGHNAAYNRRDCFRVTARTKVNHFVRSMQTRAPAQFGILRLAQLPPRISPAKCLIMRHTRSCRSPAHKQKISGTAATSAPSNRCSPLRRSCALTPRLRSLGNAGLA